MIEITLSWEDIQVVRLQHSQSIVGLLKLYSICTDLCLDLFKALKNYNF